MTTLLVDAGNSRLKWARWAHGQRSAQSILPYVAESAVQGALQQLEYLLTTQQDAERVVLVHVLGQMFAEQAQSLCTVHQRKLILVRSVNAYGIQLAYPTPAHFGADRFIGLLAGRKLAAKQAVIVIDAGTAVTIDGLEASGLHRGGVILPGLKVMVDSLVQRTQAKHMSSAILEDATVFANNTLQAMGSGCLLGLVGALEGICQRMQQQFSSPAQIILCGGDAQRLSESFRLPHQLVPDALMDGLQFMAEQEST